MEIANLMNGEEETRIVMCTGQDRTKQDRTLAGRCKMLQRVHRGNIN